MNEEARRCIVIPCGEGGRKILEKALIEECMKHDWIRETQAKFKDFKPTILPPIGGFKGRGAEAAHFNTRQREFADYLRQKQQQYGNIRGKEDNAEQGS
jgi:hypothetical protein